MKRLLLPAMLLALLAFAFGCSEERPTEPGGDAALSGETPLDTEAAAGASLHWAGADTDHGVPAEARTYEIIIKI